MLVAAVSLRGLLVGNVPAVMLLLPWGLPVTLVSLAFAAGAMLLW